MPKCRGLFTFICCWCVVDSLVLLMGCCLLVVGLLFVCCLFVVGLLLV